VHGHLIFKRNYPQVSAVQVWNCRPESVAIAFLRLTANRVLEDIRAPFFFQVRPSAKNDAFEIGRETQVFHSNRMGVVAPWVIRQSLRIRGEMYATGTGGSRIAKNRPTQQASIHAVCA